MAVEPGLVIETESGVEGVAGRGGLGRAASGALRPRCLDQGVGATDGDEPQHDSGGAADVGAAEVPAEIGAVEARSVQERDPSAAGRGPEAPGQRVRELIAPLGYAGGKTIVDDYLRDLRPLFDPPRTFQRTVYRPGEICQFDLWEPRAEIPVGHGQTRKGWVVVSCLGYSRAGAGALVFSKQTPDLLWG